MRALSLAIAMTIYATASSAVTLETSVEQQTDLTLSLYREDFGLIKDSRKLPQIASQETVIVKDISDRMRTETLRITGAGKILEQTLKSNLLSYDALLDSHIGRVITLVSAATGAQAGYRREVTLLSRGEYTAVVQSADGIESIPLNTGQWRFIFPNRPEGMLLKPSLMFRSAGASAGIATLSYLTSGMSWQMDYVATFNEQRDSMHLEALASLYNSTDTAMRNAKIRLVSGQVNNPLNDFEYLDYVEHYLLGEATAAGAEGSSVQSLGDFYLYRLPGRITLTPSQRTQIPLFSATEVKVDQRLRQNVSFYASDAGDPSSYKPTSYLHFINDKASGLGIPLPGGILRSFVPDQQGELQFAGGEELEQTSVNQAVSVALGESFDVTVETVRTQAREVEGGILVSYQLTLKNAASRAFKLDLTGSFYEDGVLVSTTLPELETTSQQADWQLELPPESDVQHNLQVKFLIPKREAQE
ncbi:MAG: DUF4139 domain-containing protein [Pseudomonadales bacterium]